MKTIIQDLDPRCATKQLSFTLFLYGFPYKLRKMENIRKPVSLSDIGDDARRQYIDAKSAFTAWEEATRRATEVRGGMYWKRQDRFEYLIRTSAGNAQKSLGPRSGETEAIFDKFIQSKAQLESRRDERFEVDFQSAQGPQPEHQKPASTAVTSQEARDPSEYSRFPVAGPR